jgi:hypothetical protein
MDQSKREAKHAWIDRSANTRLSGSWLIIARVTWLVLVIPCLVLFVVSLPWYDQQLQNVCSDPRTCNLILQSLPYVELSRSVYAALSTLLTFIFTAIWCTVGLLLFWRRSDDWLALLAAFILVIYQVTSSDSGSPLYALADAFPVLAFPLNVMSFLGEIAVGIFLLLFPHGRFVPRWMGVILLLLILNSILFRVNLEAGWPDWLNLLVNFTIYGSIVLSQIYRYRHISTPVQRQQTKWVIFGFAVVIGVVIGLLIIAALIPSLTDTPFWNEVWELILPTTLLFIPLSIGFSILRYRLYDIDVLINRTLVYGSLTISLVLIYFGLVIGLGSLVRLFAGELRQSPIIIIVSTLAIAALFRPLLQRIQSTIDRRFYRRKYDATKTVETFSATLRSEVNLQQLSERLTAVVQETMQPEHISLWLRPPVLHETQEILQSSSSPKAK